MLHFCFILILANRHEKTKQTAASVITFVSGGIISYRH